MLDIKWKNKYIIINQLIYKFFKKGKFKYGYLLIIKLITSKCYKIYFFNS